MTESEAKIRLQEIMPEFTQISEILQGVAITAFAEGHTEGYLEGYRKAGKDALETIDNFNHEKD